jgi:hypothetical protein
MLHPYLGRRIGTEDAIIGMPLALTKRLLEQAYQQYIETM